MKVIFALLLLATLVEAQGKDDALFRKLNGFNSLKLKKAERIWDHFIDDINSDHYLADYTLISEFDLRSYQHLKKTPSNKKLQKFFFKKNKNNDFLRWYAEIDGFFKSTLIANNFDTTDPYWWRGANIKFILPSLHPLFTQSLIKLLEASKRDSLQQKNILFFLSLISVEHCRNWGIWPLYNAAVLDQIKSTNKDIMAFRYRGALKLNVACGL